MKLYIDKLKIIRAQQGLSAEKLALRMGINRTTYCSWEYGKRIPSEPKIRLLAKALNVPVDEISDLIPEAPVSPIQFSDAIQSWISLTGTKKNKQHEKIKFLIDGINSLHKELSDTRLITNALITSNASIFYVKDVNSNYITANIPFLENLSLNKSYSVLNKTDYDFFSQKEADQNDDQDKQVLFTGKSIINQEGYVPGSRKKKWCLISKIPVFDDENKIEGIVGSFVDITERKKSEYMRELLEYNINAMHEVLSLYNIENNQYIYINKAIEKMYGYPIEKFYGKGRNFWLNTCVHPDDRKKLEKQNFAAMEDKYTEYRIIRPDGEVRWIESFYSIKDVVNMKCVLTLNRDITEQKKIEQEKKVLYQLLSKSDDIISIYDIDKGQTIYINDIIEKITGCSAESFCKKPGILFNQYLNPLGRKKQTKYLKDEDWPETGKFSMRCKDGKTRLYEYRINRDNIFGRNCTITISRDITEKEKIKEQIEQLEEAIDSMSVAITFRDLETNNFLYRNKATEKLWGYPIGKFKKSENYDFWLNNLIIPEDKEKISEYIKTGKFPEKFQYLYKMPDGSLRWIESITSTKKYLGRNCIAIISRDITESVTSKEQVEHLEMSINTMSTAISVFDLKAHRYLYANKAAENLWGYPCSVDDFLKGGNHDYWMNNIVNEDEKEKISGYIKTGKFPKKFEYLYKMPDGSLRWIESTTSVTQYSGRDCLTSISRDITERKREIEVKELLELTIHAMSDSYSLRDLATNKYLYLNPAIKKVFGYPAKDFYNGGTQFWINTVVYKDDRPQLLSYLKKQDWPEKFEYRIVKPDGKIHWIEAVISQEKYLGKLCLATINRDITEVKESSELKQFISNACLVSEGLVIVGMENSRYMYLNKAIEKIYGYPLEKFYNNSQSFWYDTCLHPEDKDKELEFLDKKSWPQKRRFRIIRPDGDIRYLESVLSSEINYKGQKCIATIDIDITDKINLENEVLRLQKELAKRTT